MKLHSIGQGKRNDLTSVNANRGSTTRDEVGKIIGMSGVQITKLLLIDRENPELIDLIDEGLYSINQSYLHTKRTLIGVTFRLD